MLDTYSEDEISSENLLLNIWILYLEVGGEMFDPL